MGEPAVEVLGVYRLNVTDALFREQLSILYPDNDRHPDRATGEWQVREQLRSVVLIEALIRNRDDRFDAGDFTQFQKDVPRRNWQVAWAEAYLSADGTSLAVERWSPPPVSGDLRIAFFFHFWDHRLPLRSSYGKVMCPRPQRMPERLERLVPYEPTS